LKIKELSIKGCLLIEYAPYMDERGTFVKTFNRDLFKGTSLENFSAEEEFFTQSFKNVIRGLHFQIPPFSHNKIVSCSLGKVMDVLLDLRVSSSTYGSYCAVDLSSKLHQSLYIPVGVAHGFISRSDASIVCYKVDKKYSSEHDAGVAWDSFSFDWGADTPILSARDRAFPSLAKFKSPF
jgi:dTDP-4-dehydrorhamnose 3,5-epimerase